MRWRALTAIAAIIVTLAIVAWPYARVASFVVRAAGVGGWLDESARALTVSIAETHHMVPTRHGMVRLRLYRPATRPDRTVLLVSGMHGAGIEEPRLIRMAHEIAATGWAVATPELPELVAYRITPRSTDVIEDTGMWLTRQRDLVPDGRIGLLGVSFSGGLAIVAAGRAPLRDRTRFVLSFGGHGNLPRLLRYFCTGIEPPIDGHMRSRPPHDYGLALMAVAMAERLVPPAQVDRFHDAVVTFLRASGLAVLDPQSAEAVFQQARGLEQLLPEPSRTLMHYVNERNVGHLGQRLLPYIDEFGGDPSLSPDRSSPPSAPVFLLHGSEDNVIPSVETRLLSRWLEGKTRVHVFLSDPISHVDVIGRASLRDYWGLISFWRALLAQ